MRAELTSALAAIALLGLAGCDKYVDRRDPITFGVGDAVAANKAMQIIDPWPASSRTITHGMRGEQAEAALEKLRQREKGGEVSVGQPQPQPSQLGSAPTGRPQ